MNVPCSLSAFRTWTADDVAKYLRLHRRTVLHMAERGEIPSIPFGKLYRFDPGRVRALFVDELAGERS